MIIDYKEILRKASHLIPDKPYLILKYYQRMHKWLDLKNPITYTEKLQWLKLNNRDPLQTKLVDKAEVKKYISEKIGNEYLIKTLGIWEKFEDIDFNKLPQQFVLKCTHDSGGLVICRDKNELDIEAARRKIDRCLKKNFYWHSREWPYKNVKPRIIAEEYLVDESGYELKDYKFFCFNGEVKALFIATDRGVAGEETKFDFYDEHFNHLPIKNGHENAQKELKCPENFETMKELAAGLSIGMPHVRVDFYNANGRIYFGEMTFYHWGGLMPFEPEEWDKAFGDWIALPERE